MGQQQLLLTILVTIIIGVATIIAVDTLQQSRIESNRSSVRQDMIMAISDARMYYEKPEVMGGGGKSFDGISIDNIVSIATSNANGSYAISGSDSSVTVEGTGNFDEVALSATATVLSGDLTISWSEL
jgi:Tfp pilus assembly protein PilE